MYIVKRAFFTIIPLSIFLSVLVIIAEVWLRQQHITWDPHGADSGPKSHTHCYQPSYTTGYEAIPNTCNRDAQGTYRTWEGEAPSTAYNILVIGDSIADQHDWVLRATYHLEQKWKTPVATRNAGTPGFDTCSELQLFKEKYLQTDIDLLLLQFCPNDLAVTATIIPLETGHVRFYTGWEYTEFPSWVLYSKLLTYILLQTSTFKGDHTIRRASIEPVKGCLEQFKQLTQENGIELQVVLFPPFVDDYSDKTPIVSMREHNLSAEEAEQASKKAIEDAKLPYFNVRSVYENRELSLVTHRDHENDLWHPDRKSQKFIGEDLATYIDTQIKP